MKTKIPLTIKHTKKDLVYFQISELQLGALLDLEFDRLFKRYRELKRDWIKNNRCKCVKDLKEGKELICKHIDKCLKEDKLCIETRDKITRMSSASVYRNMFKFKLKGRILYGRKEYC